MATRLACSGRVSSKAVLIRSALNANLHVYCCVIDRLFSAADEGKLGPQQRVSEVRRPPRSARAGCFVGVCAESVGGDKIEGNRQGVGSSR